MTLPDDLQQEFVDEADRIEEEHKVPFMTSPERRGFSKAQRKGIVLCLEARFGSVPQSILAALDEVKDSDVLRDLTMKAAVARDLESFQTDLSEQHEGSD